MEAKVIPAEEGGAGGGAVADPNTPEEPATPTAEELKAQMVAKYGQETIDAVCAGVDTGSWTEDDWKYQIYLYRNNSATEASEKLKNWLVEEYGWDVVDAVSNGVDTDEWTEDDWTYYIWLYQNRIAGEELKAAMAEQYGQETIDAISAENDTSEWTEDDWEYYIWLYRNTEDEDKPEGEEDSGESGSKANLLDDTGKFIDDTLENNYQAYIKRKISKGQTPKDRLEWKQASEYWTKESPVARGNNFNKTVREADIYDYHEIYLENGKRLDSYDPDAGEIISRKATDLDKINEETYRRYLSEFSSKYSEGTKIRSNAYPELDGQELRGQYILEIPASNANLSNIDYYEKIASEYDVILRFTETSYEKSSIN